MASTPPVLVVLDLSALAVISPQEWAELSRVGRVYLPHTVYEELRFVFDRSPDPDIEAISRAFNRFYPTSGWETTDATAAHAAFKPPSGQAVTKRARLSLAAARCAVALSQNYPVSIVVLVTSDRLLLQKLQELPEANLTGITPQEALQWSRTGHRTVAVLHKMHQLRGMQGTGTTLRSATPTVTTARRPTMNSSSSLSTSTTRTVQRSQLRPAGVSSDAMRQTVSLLLAVAGLLVAGWLVWTVIQQFRSEASRLQQQQQQHERQLRERRSPLAP